MLSLSFLDIEAISDWISLAYLPPFFFLNEKRKIVLVLSQWALETEFFWEACYGSCPPRGIPFELSGLKSSEKSRTSLTVSMNPLSLDIVETKVIVMGLDISILGTLLGLNVPMIQ